MICWFLLSISACPIIAGSFLLQLLFLKVSIIFIFMQEKMRTCIYYAPKIQFDIRRILLRKYFMTRLYIDPNIAKATTLSTEFYNTTEYFEAAKEKIFATSWQFIGSKEMVKFS